MFQQPPEGGCWLVFRPRQAHGVVALLQGDGNLYRVPQILLGHLGRGAGLLQFPEGVPQGIDLSLIHI